jgi:hypothetical protein
MFSIHDLLSGGQGYHRQHETSPSTLLRSTNRPRSQREREASTPPSTTTKPSMSTIERRDGNNDPGASLRSQRQSQRIEPTSHNREQDQTPNPTQNLYKSSQNHQRVPSNGDGHTEARANPPLSRRSDRRNGVTYEKNRGTEGSQMPNAANRECSNREKPPRLDG